MKSLFDRATDHFCQLQERIVVAMEELDEGARFVRDDWERAEQPVTQGGPILRGWGRTRVLEHGRVIERGGVNISCVDGEFGAAEPSHMPGTGRHFRAVGISLVLHPVNPHAPTVHMNYRRLERGEAGWFGGGADLTPNYLYREDARQFHAVHRDVCDRHGDLMPYSRLKAACDEYFYLPHRGETRGVGGIFFDHAQTQPDATFAFVTDASNAFLEAYHPLLARRGQQPWTEAERQWQLLRRGRYVEFNLVFDRGTQFGLRTGGRIESILMSLPATACWAYDHAPAPGSPEAEMLSHLRPVDWLGLE